MYNVLAPITGSGISLSVTQANTQGTLGATGDTLLLTNLGPNKVYVRIATAAATAVVTTDMALLPSTAIVIARPVNCTAIAAICDTGETATLKASLNYGV